MINKKTRRWATIYRSLENSIAPYLTKSPGQSKQYRFRALRDHNKSINKGENNFIFFDKGVWSVSAKDSVLCRSSSFL